MKTITKYFMLFIILTAVTSSCFKEDEKVYIPPLIGSDTVVLGNHYGNQVWIDLNGLQEKANHKIDSWDLAFSCDENSFDIRLNSALTMYAGTNKEKIFENVTSEEGVEMSFDASSGNPDSLAFGQWYQIDGNIYKSNEFVYIVNRGIGADLIELGYKKVQLFIEDQTYLIRHANLDGTDEKNLVIEKDNSFNYIHLSFEDGIVEIEPMKNDWTLKFSKYSTILTTDLGDPYDYNVVGVLLNPYKVLAIETDTIIHPYDSIQLIDTAYYQLTNQNDVLGYNWKEYIFDDAAYKVYKGKSYIIKDKDGYFYKLHFINFYDKFGNKGSISYQIERL